MTSRWIIAAVLAGAALVFAQVQAPKTAEAIEASKVPDNEKLKVSADSVAVMKAALKDVLQKVEEAQGKKGTSNSQDVLKLTCVNEKLTQIKGLLRISEQSDVALQEAISRREAQAADHEFTKVTIARSKVDQLRAEAEQCMGQLAFKSDEKMTLELEVPSYLPKNDPSLIPFVLLGYTIVVRPVPASPTM